MTNEEIRKALLYLLDKVQWSKGKIDDMSIFANLNMMETKIKECLNKLDEN